MSKTANTQSHRPKQTQVSIRGDVYDRLRTYARGNGTQIRTVVDTLIRKFLDDNGRSK